jgi:outer membrane murein-binding lipoprotein Lpp
MDVFNPDVWKQQWATFVSAPYIIAPFVIGAFFGGWLLRGIKSEGKIAGLETKIEGLASVFEARLRFADDRAARANEVRDDIARQFKDFKADVVAGAGMDALTARVATIEAMIDKLAVANNAVRSAIGAARVSSTSSMSVNVSLSNSPLPLRDPEEGIKPDKDG